MTTDPDDALVSALLDGRPVSGEPGLQQALALLRAARGVPAPAPSAELLLVLRDGIPPAVAPRPDRERVAWRIAVASLAALVLTGGAAAANALPGPVQDAVADVVGRVASLDVPRADDGPDRPPSGATGPSLDEPAAPLSTPRPAQQSAAPDAVRTAGPLARPPAPAPGTSQQDGSGEPAHDKAEGAPRPAARPAVPDRPTATDDDVPATQGPAPAGRPEGSSADDDPRAEPETSSGPTPADPPGQTDDSDDLESDLATDDAGDARTDRPQLPEPDAGT